MINAALKVEQQDEEQQHLVSSGQVDVEKKRLREFGVVMGLVISLISAYLLYRERTASVWFLLATLYFVGSAWFAPTTLRRVEKGWLWFGERMSVVMTFLLLTLTYYLVMTPIALLLRVMKKDILDLKLDKSAKTYWKKVEENGPHTRPFSPY
jgi:hypothetical protein